MNLSEQVTSLEVSQKLKELGVKQDSYFYWVIDEKVSDKPFVHYAHQPLSRKRYSAAFTASELGEMMKEDNISSGYIAEDMGWWAECLNAYGKVKGEDTEAEARGKLRIYLLENNLTTPTVGD